MTKKEIDFVYEVLGNKSLFVVNTHVFPFFMKRSTSQPIKSIFISENFNDPISDPSSVNTFIHEIYHQMEYECTPTLSVVGDFVFNFIFIGEKIIYKKLQFDRLVAEQIRYSLSNIDVYNYGDIDNIKTLNNITNLESRAQFVGDFAEYYYLARYRAGLSKERKEKLIKMNNIMKNSNMKSEATQWIDENL